MRARHYYTVVSAPTVAVTIPAAVSSSEHRSRLVDAEYTRTATFAFPAVAFFARVHWLACYRTTKFMAPGEMAERLIGCCHYFPLRLELCNLSFEVFNLFIRLRQRFQRAGEQVLRGSVAFNARRRHKCIMLERTSWLCYLFGTRLYTLKGSAVGVVA